MTDILRRLREPPFGTETSERNLFTAAADEIERLQRVTADLLASVKPILDDLGAAGQDGWTSGYVHVTDLDRLNAAIDSATTQSERQSHE